MKKLLVTLLAAALLIPAGCGTRAAPTSPTPTSAAESFADVPGAVIELARTHLAETAETCGFAVAETELTGIVRLCTYENLLPDAAATVYRLEYRLKPEKPDEVVMAGGRTLDEEGWLLQYESMGNPCLVVSEAGDTALLLGKTWDGEVGLDGGWEGRLGSLLMQWGKEREDASMTLAGETTFARSLLAGADAALAPLLGKAPVEGEPCADEAGHIWHKLSGYEKYQNLRMDDQLLSALYPVFPQDLVNGLFHRFIYLPDSILLEREGGLYVRDDAAQVMDWDYTADLSTLTVDESRSGEDRLEFTVRGTGHGGTLTWLFTALRGEDGMWRFYRYYTLAADGWGAPPEFAVLADGEWFGLGSGAAPAALGEPDRLEKDPNNAYSNTGFWRTEYYDGVTATRYDDGVSSAVYGIVTLEVCRPGLPTWRGVEVGDSLDAVAAAYPEAVTADIPDHGAGSYLFFETTPNMPGFFMEFYFDEHQTLASMLIKNAFD